MFGVSNGVGASLSESGFVVTCCIHCAPYPQEIIVNPSTGKKLGGGEMGAFKRC